MIKNEPEDVTPRRYDITQTRLDLCVGYMGDGCGTASIARIMCMIIILV